MDNVLVTVGLCVKNCEKTIGQTIDSTINQKYPHNSIELIVVSDGCSDNTIPIVVEKLSKADIKSRILETGSNGLGMARQKVVDNAKGKYIIWIDGDIVIPPDHISKQVKFMESHPHIGKARANWGSSKTGKILGDLQFLAHIDEVKSGIQSKMAGIGGSICRVDAIKDVGGFDTQIKGAWEDVDLAIRILERGWDISVSDTIFFHEPKTSWKDLWRQYVWYGHGGHYVRHKHHMRNIGMEHVPLVAIAIGIKKAVSAFKFSRKKRSFFLPLFSLFCSLAWWVGFIEAGFGNVSEEVMH